MKTKSIFAAVLLSLLAALPAWSQGLNPTVQFTGIIIAGQESTPVPGVYVIIPKASRATVTNDYGYFSIAVFPGDSVVFSSIGYKKKYHLVPPKTTGTYSVIIDLMEDITQLSPVTIYPFPTEEIFKENFLALQLPDEKDQQNMRRNLDDDRLDYIRYNSGMSGSENFRNFNNQQVNGFANRNFNPTWNFLNPFAWSQFIKSIKNGDLKKKEYRKGN